MSSESGGLLGWALRSAVLITILGGGAYFVATGLGLDLAALVKDRKAAPAATARRPAPPAGHAGDRTYVLPANDKGQFWVTARVNDTDVRFMVDTGATDVVLDRSAAEAAGLRPRRHEFTRPYRTPNGTVYAAPVTLREVRIGPIELRDVPAVVNEVDMGGMALLGMGFLKRLEGFESRRDRLILKW
ncbi:MAG: TIGR02281 family clan AA aspartic protease [Hyphomicrobiales bacterium]|nr:TIGR02281 family clan AA aspartic protease [Hyphomicrobiales bacterium]MCP5371132.1 TIGR02281 family clan AA aspartic protease [Hyphomicrobiales bacterium]